MKDIKYLVCNLSLCDCLGDCVATLIYHLLFISWWTDIKSNNTEWTLINLNDIQKKLNLKLDEIKDKIKILIKNNILKIKRDDENNLYISFDMNDERVRWCTKLFDIDKN